MRNSSKEIILSFAIIISFCTLITEVITILFSKDKIIMTTATITYLNIEGGFYGIVGDDGNHYDPIRLPGFFKLDGLRVEFLALRRDDLTSFHMWGIIIQILSIQPV
ncbi:MAG: hypothetical protein ACFFB0_22455 [Promethearchaeota archaeon]